MPLRHHRSLDSLNIDTRFHESFSPKHYDQPLRADTKSSADAKEDIDSSKGTQNESRNKLDLLIHESTKVRFEEDARINSGSLESDNRQKGNFSNFFLILI